MKDESIPSNAGKTMSGDAVVESNEKRQREELDVIEAQNDPINKKPKVLNGSAVVDKAEATVAPAETNGNGVAYGALSSSMDESAATESKNPEMEAAAAAAAFAAAEAEMETGRRRPRRAAVLAQNNIIAAVEAPKARPPKAKKSKVTNDEEEFKMAWICCECKEAECMMHPDADQLLICDGSCRRLFHYPCAGLSKPPAEDESYVCQDCQNGRHLCGFCQSYGIDNEDVFPCCEKKCGLFFHEACLEMRDIEVKLVEGSCTTDSSLHGNNDGDAAKAPVGPKREFKCPAHVCATCYQKDMVEKEKKAAAESRKAEKKRGRKKAKAVANPSFGYKSGQTMIRCLICPNSYHVTCIPPTARFNELSLLCPDHVANNKLPDLDPEDSLQALIEKKIDAKYAEVESPTRRRGSERKRRNPFFNGLSGKTLTSLELEMVRGFENDLTHGPLETVSYCLPCSIRDEVHAKPPAYKHIHSNRYNPGNSPKPLKHSGERCSCIEYCDESCFNRVLYVECTLDKDSKFSNCAVGKACGNRRLGQRKFKKCLPKREQGKGWGLVLKEDVKKGDLIIEYIGEVIDEKRKQERLRAWAEEHPNDPNFYIMGLGKGWYVDARDEANLSRFINHSCDPNAVVHTINVSGLMRNGIFALRDIKAGSFISYDYHFETMHGDRFVCRCGSAKCRGTMKDAVLQTDDSKSKRQLWDAAKRDFERDKAYLEDFETKREARRSLVDAMVPGAEFSSDLVSNGPSKKHRLEAIRGRLFLWRNARLGADFAKRFQKFEDK